MTSQRLSRSIFGAELCNRLAPVFKIQSLIVIHCFRDMSSRPGIVVSIGKGQIRPAGKCEARCAKLYHDGCLFISKGYRAGRRGRNCTHGLGGRRRRREQSAFHLRSGCRTHLFVAIWLSRIAHPVNCSTCKKGMGRVKIISKYVIEKCFSSASAVD